MVRSCCCRSRRKGKCADSSDFAVARTMGVGRLVGAHPRDGRRPARRLCKEVRFLRERRAERFQNLLVILDGEGHCSVSSSFGWSGSKRDCYPKCEFVCAEKKSLSRSWWGVWTRSMTTVCSCYSPWRETFMPVAGGCRAVIHFGLESSNPS